MIESWDDLDYWNSGEWQWVQEKLDELDRAGILYNPPRHKLFAALDSCPVRDVRVVIIGQDPYPDRSISTGIAFSIPEDMDDYPPSLINLFSELDRDLHTGMPSHGNLMDWVKQGVLLWNAYPSCVNGKPGSHHWPEWEPLTREIVERAPACIFVFLGNKARAFAKYISEERQKAGIIVLEYSHPSPLGYMAGKTPFKGSRMFSTINSHLVNPIDWRLDDVWTPPERQRLPPPKEKGYKQTLAKVEA